MADAADRAHPEPPQSAVTWGPVAAVVVTLAIYVLSQTIAGLIIVAYAMGSGRGSDQTNEWLQASVFAQFAYVTLVEAASIGLLWQFLRSRKASLRTLGLVKPRLRDAGYALLGVGMYVPILVLVMAVAKVIFPQLDLEQEQQIGFEAAHSAWQLAAVFVSLAVLPPVVEEIMCRGFLYLGLKARLPKVWAVLGTSVLFAVAHLQFGSDAPLLWTAAIDTFVLSLVLIYLRDKTNALWAPIGLHMLKNSIAFFALFIFS